MIKKLLVFLCAGAFALTLAGCGGQVEQLDTLEAPSSSSIEQGPFPEMHYYDTLESLCSYMEDNEAVTGESVEMSYKEIGAVGGVRYRFKFDGSIVQAEFYEFDLDNQNEKAKECLGSVQEKGFFTILGSDVPAQLHGKYLMVYTDTDKDEANAAQREKVEKLFSEFTPTAG